MPKDKDLLEFYSDVNGFLKDVKAERKKSSLSSADSIDLLCEIPKKGTLLCKLSKEGNDLKLKSPDKKFENPDYAGALYLTGFNEETKYFKKLEDKLMEGLKPYRFLRSKI